MQERETRHATPETPEAVPKWLRMTGIGLGVVLVPPIVLPIFALVMAIGMLAFLPFVPLLIAEFVYSARNTKIEEDKERERQRDSGFGRVMRARPHRVRLT